MIRYYFKWLWFLCRANEETISRVNKYGLLEEQHCDPEEIAIRTARHWYPGNMKPGRDAYLVLSCRQTPGRLGQLWKSAQGQDYFKDPVTKTARWSARCSDIMLWCWKNICHTPCHHANAEVAGILWPKGCQAASLVDEFLWHNPCVNQCVVSWCFWCFW